MIKPKIRHGKQCLEKRFLHLEEGEFFLHPDTGHVCSILHIVNDVEGDLMYIEYYNYFLGDKNRREIKDLEEFVQLVRVEIVYWLAEEKDLFQEKG